MALMLFLITGSLWVLRLSHSGKIFSTLYDTFKGKLLKYDNSAIAESPNIASYSSVLGNI